ncbi:MAG: hypothetical protein ACRDYZ_10775 [Acidimicrobiales bacterium]
MRDGLGRILRRHWPELALGAGYVAANLSLSLTGRPHVAIFNDSATYLVPSFTGSSGRLWFVPVLYWLAGSDGARVVLQTVVGTCCWLALAAVLARMLTARALRRAGVGIVLLVGLSPEVVQWNRAILSESLAISVSVALLAASIWLLARRSWCALAVWLTLVLAWAFSRQVQALIVVVLAFPLLVMAVRRPAVRKKYLVGAAAVVAIASWGVVASLQASSITRFNAIAIVRYRVETHPGELQYLEARGLPMVAPLRAPIPFGPAGLPVNVTEHANPTDMTHLLASPQLVDWIDQRWDGVYARYLVTHPATALGPPIANAPALMTVDPGYVQGKELPVWLLDVTYGASPAYLLVLFGLAVIVAVAAGARGRASATLWLLGAALAFDYLWCAAVWNLSASELPRLYDPQAVVAHVLLDALLLAGVDSWWRGSRVRHRRGRHREDEECKPTEGTQSLVPVGVPSDR